jgi:hypothetical protein
MFLPLALSKHTVDSPLSFVKKVPPAANPGVARNVVKTLSGHGG